MIDSFRARIARAGACRVAVDEAVEVERTVDAARSPAPWPRQGSDVRRCGEMCFQGKSRRDGSLLGTPGGYRLLGDLRYVVNIFIQIEVDRARSAAWTRKAMGFADAQPILRGTVESVA